MTGLVTDAPVMPAPGTSGRHPARRRVLLATLFVGIVVVMMRPSWNLLTQRVVNLGDPVLFGWSWSWTRHALITDPLHLFDGNIFWHHDLTVAYTDNMLVLLAPYSVLRALGAGWALQINLLTLGMLTGSLAATYALTHRLVGRVDAAVFAAVSFTFGSYTFSHLGHLQLLLLAQFPLGFWLAFRWLERRRVGDAVAFGLVNASFFLGALYYAAIWTVCVAVVLGGWLVAARFRPGRRFWSGLAVVAAFSATAIPFVLPYLDLGRERPLVPEWGLQPRDLAIVATGSYLYPGLDDRANESVDRSEHSFFPGFMAAGLALVGAGTLVVASTARRRSRMPAPIPHRLRELWILVAAGGAAVILALGPEVRGHRMPFAWFHDHVPGFSGIRVAARLAMPGFLALAVLAGLGMTVIVTRLRPRLAAAIGIALCAALGLELAAPVFSVHLPDDRRTLAVYHALDGRPTGAVAELPMESTHDGAAWAFVEAPRMLYSTLDLHPRVNGYSGSWPDDYAARRAVFNRFPADPTVRAMRRLGVRYVVLHVGRYAGIPQYGEAAAAAIVRRLPRGATARRHGNAWLVDLGPSPESR